jgi:NADH-quinone oxidoreductase subunit N
VYLRWLRPVVTTAEVTGAPEPAETTQTTQTRRPAARGPGNRRIIIAGLVVSSALLAVVSVQPDVLLRLFG